MIIIIIDPMLFLPLFCKFKVPQLSLLLFPSHIISYHHFLGCQNVPRFSFCWVYSLDRINNKVIPEFSKQRTNLRWFSENPPIVLKARSICGES